MRILYLAGLDVSLPQGHAVHVRRLCDAFEQRGHRLRLICHAPSLPLGWAGPEGEMRLARTTGIPGLRPLFSEWRLRCLIRREIREYEPDLLLVRSSLFGFAALGLSRRHGIPLLVETNSSVPALVLAEGGSRTRARVAHHLEGALLRSADGVGAVTNNLAQIQISQHALAPEKVGVVPNGAWLPPARQEEAISLRRELGISDQEFLVAFIGNLNRVQGVEVILRAIARVESSPLRLWVVGVGKEATALRLLATQLGIAPRAQFLGGVTEEAAALHAQAAQVLVAPYRASGYLGLGGEDGAIKVLQGLASGRFLLVSRIPGLEFVEQLGAGELVDSEEPEAWAQALSDLIRRWRDAGSPLANWPWPAGSGPGRKYIEEHRTWDHTARAWEALFEKVVGSRAFARRARGESGPVSSNCVF